MNTREAILEQRDKKEDRSVITLLDSILLDAHVCGASDIHIDPTGDSLCVRLRIDGLLKEAYRLPSSVHNELLARLKIVASLRTDEHFSPQDGRFAFSLPEKSEVDVRLSILPTYHGENAVLRLLAPETESHTLASLGIESSLHPHIYGALERGHGMILVSGPTGSGKTTTLYALMRILRERSLSLVTIEDPVEYSMSGVCQIQTNQRTGLSFAQGLRSILRQDPDVIMVGEIRDTETARLAVNAALTGHLVLSTLHTNGAAEALPRLADMGIEPYLLASTVRLVLAQRLVRRTCRECTGGCAVCGETKYRGRLGIFELLPVTPSIENAVLQKVSARKIKSIAVNEGMTTLEEAGLTKYAQGVTTLEELARMRHG